MTDKLFEGPPLSVHLAHILELGVSAFEDADLRRCEDPAEWTRHLSEMLIPDTPIIRWDLGALGKNSQIGRGLPSREALYVIPIELTMHPDYRPGNHQERVGFNRHIQGTDHVPPTVSPLLSHSVIPRIEPCPVEIKLLPMCLNLQLRTSHDIQLAYHWVSHRMAYAQSMLDEFRPVFQAWVRREAESRIREIQYAEALEASLRVLK